MLIAALAVVATMQVDAGLPREVAASIAAERCREDIERLVSFGTRHSLSDTESPTQGIGAARNWIRGEFERISAATGGRLQVAFEEFDVPKGPRMPRDARLMNVVAVLPGTDPTQAARRYYVVGHYDSRNGDGNDVAGAATGANDDASGTTVVIECARALAGRALPATIVFLATVAEEQGLYGAKYHADQARARGDQILGVLSNDIVGDPLGPIHPRSNADRDLENTPIVGTVFRVDRVPTSAIRVFSEGLPRNATAEQINTIRTLSAESDSPSRQLARFVADVALREQTAIQPRLVFRLDRFLRGGDHSSFNEAGFPAVRFTVPAEDFDRQHQDVRVEGQGAAARHYGDTTDFCDFEYIANVARLNAAVLVHLASSPPPPTEVRVVTARLSNSTTLRWSPAPGASTYEVVWRETTSPTWTGSLDVGAVHEATLNLSKDDLHFGVRAVASGWKSPVAFAAAAGR